MFKYISLKTIYTTLKNCELLNTNYTTKSQNASCDWIKWLFALNNNGSNPKHQHKKTINKQLIFIGPTQQVSTPIWQTPLE